MSTILHTARLNNKNTYNLSPKYENVYIFLIGEIYRCKIRKL